MTTHSASLGHRSHHRWRFYRTGGVFQPLLDRGEDLAHLDELDLKYWLALAMPVTGIEFDPRTAELLDTDRDGRIRPPEVIAAVKWACAALSDPSVLLTPGDSLPLAAIRDTAIQTAAKRLMADLGRPDAAQIALADAADRSRHLAAARFNGDGVVTEDTAEDDATRQVIREIVAALGGVPDRSGKPGVDAAKIGAFFAQAGALVAWADRAAAEPALMPLGPEATAAAAAAVRAVRAKVEDYFARCRLAAFDPTARPAVNRSEADYRAVAANDLTAGDAAIAALPLAPAAGGRPLTLSPDKVNPAWSAAIAELRVRAVAPLLGDRAELTEPEWRELLGKLAAWEAWSAAKPSTPVEALGLPRLRELLASDANQRLQELVAKDLEPAPEIARVAEVEKLLRFRRDLGELLMNFVNFARFYSGQPAVFQAGTLYLDARACRLCLEVTDAGKHAALAGFSGGYLAYCDITRPGGLKKTIVAVFTDGDSDNLMVGRNGVFYDRQGRDWDATITKVVANPISIREAFWMPYKKLVRLIEEQFARRAAAAEAASGAKIETAAAQVAAAGTTPAPAAPAAPKKFDLGSIALVGVAIGGISALIGGLLQALFGLGWLMPLGVLGIILLISGPSMLLAALKLRRRNLGPLLDANGWAINTRARLNIPFGARLTEVAAPPLGAVVPQPDPFAERRVVRPGFIIALLIAAAAFLVSRMVFK